MHGSNINWLNVASVGNETLPDNKLLLLWLKPKVGAYLSFDCVSSRNDTLYIVIGRWVFDSD